MTGSASGERRPRLLDRIQSGAWIGITAPKPPFDIPRGEHSFASCKGKFCARVRPQSQRGSGEKGFLAGTERRDRGFGALQVLVRSGGRKGRLRSGSGHPAMQSPLTRSCSSTGALALAQVTGLRQRLTQDSA